MGVDPRGVGSSHLPRSSAPTDGVRVRFVRPSDSAELAAIYAPHCITGTASFETTPPTADEMAQRVRVTTSTYPWLVAVDEADGSVLGYAYGTRHRERPGYRWSVDVAVYLAASATGRGIGRTLYARLLPLLEEQGLHRAYAGIALPNDASVGLHRAMGFEPVGTYREVGFKLGAWLDVQWWSRPLAEPGTPPAEPIPVGGLPARLLTDLR